MGRHYRLRAASTVAAGDALDAIMNAPLVRCDQAPWDLLGVSLAGWNFLISDRQRQLSILWLLGRQATMTQLNEQTNDQQDEIDRMIRVDQAGEFGATRIYEGQLAVMGDRGPHSA